MMSDLIDQARFQIDRYGHTTKGTSLSLVNTIERLQAKIKELETSNKDKSQLLASFRSQIKQLEAALTNLAKSPQGFDGYWKDYARAALQENNRAERDE